MTAVTVSEAAAGDISGRLASLRLPQGVTARRLAWGSFMVCAVATLAGLVLAVLSEPSEEADLGNRTFDFVILSYPLAGAWIVSRRPENLVGWLFCLTGIFWAAARFAHGYEEYTTSGSEPSLPAGDAATWVAAWAWVPAVYVMLFALPAHFPDGHLPSQRWKPVLWIIGGAAFLSTLYRAFSPEMGAGDGEGEDNPLGLSGAAGQAVEALGLFEIFMPLSVIAAFVALFTRYRRGSPDQRQQLRWVLVAIGVLVFAFAVQIAIPDALAGVDPSVVGLTAFPLAATFAILRYRLYDLEPLLNRALVYGTLTAVIVGVYVLVIGYLGALFDVGNNLAVSLVAAGAVAVIFQPLRDWLQRAVNRLLYGERDEPDRVISRLGQRLEASLAPETVLPAIAETVGHALKLPRVEVALREGSELVVDATYESSSARAVAGEPISFALIYQNEEVGALLAWPRAQAEPFSSGDRRLLEELARHAGVAAHAVRLTRDLQRSRERLVATREEERRRLRRDLHDGLGPALAALGLRLEAVRGMVREAPEQAESQITTLREQVQAAIGDVRRLVYGLRPPALDELGLAGALEQQAAALTAGDGSGPRFTVECGRLPALPAAVEVAAYRIAVEAMTNAQRHSAARRCTIRLDVRGGLHLDVEDDGKGVNGAAWGVGLSSMQERAAELGGSLSLQDRSAGGTLVSARLPLEPAP